jgi:hypothetical protein
VSVKSLRKKENLKQTRFEDFVADGILAEVCTKFVVELRKSYVDELLVVNFRCCFNPIIS